MPFDQAPEVGGWIAVLLGTGGSGRPRQTAGAPDSWATIENPRSRIGCVPIQNTTRKLAAEHSPNLESPQEKDVLSSRGHAGLVGGLALLIRPWRGLPPAHVQNSRSTSTFTRMGTDHVSDCMSMVACGSGS